MNITGRLTGAPDALADVELSLTSFTAMMTESDVTLSCACPEVAFSDALNLRSNGSLQILVDGSVWVEAPVSLVSTKHSLIDISGYDPAYTNGAPGVKGFDGSAIYRSSTTTTGSSAERRRIPFDNDIFPGDTIQIDGAGFLVKTLTAYYHGDAPLIDLTGEL
ncbi:MAG: hypothetical protein RPU42_11110 [Candidatus Sedimenticola sp. (ex Thyasira tokunagai)]